MYPPKKAIHKKPPQKELSICALWDVI